MIKYYIIPSNVHYVERLSDIESWEQTDKIDFDVPTVAVIEDSKATYYTQFIVIYKGKMQTQGGSGACYNPCKKVFLSNDNPMDNSIMPKHMSKWITFDYNYLLKLVISAKFNILRKMQLIDFLFHWDIKDYTDNMFGLLIGKLDLIGMRLADKSILERNVNQKKLLLLNS